jgi:hypothetical protein
MSKLTHHNSVLTGWYHVAPTFQSVAEDIRHESRDVSGSCWPTADEVECTTVLVQVGTHLQRYSVS